MCGNCSGGSTGIEPVTDPDICAITSSSSNLDGKKIFSVHPNPANNYLEIITDYASQYDVKLMDILGVVHYAESSHGNHSLDTSIFPPGPYVIVIAIDGDYVVEKVILY